MPNWCQNELSVTVNDNSTNDNLNNFISFNESGKSKLDFNKLIPMPDEIKNTSSPNNSDTKNLLINKYGVDNWYDWSIKKWGTKWNLCLNEVYIDRSDMNITYSFDTAWSPPIPWIMKLIDSYSNLDINLEYQEPSMNFGGKIQYNNGELNILEYELSDHIWENCDKDYIRQVINQYITNENVNLNSDLDNYIYDIIDEIQDEIDNAYCIIDNVKELMVEIINNAIDEEDISKLDYSNNGDEITKISL